MSLFKLLLGFIGAVVLLEVSIFFSSTSIADPAESKLGASFKPSLEQTSIAELKNPAFGDRNDARKNVGEKLSPLQEISLMVSPLGFFPKVLFVTQNLAVRLFSTAIGPNALCFIAEDINIKSAVPVNTITELTFTPKKEGKIRFYCPINKAEGFIVVRSDMQEKN